MFRQEDIERLMEALNIVDVVGEFVELRKAGANYKGLCPFHADSNPSFSVNPQKNICKCFVCGAGGNPISFYSKYKKISFQEAIRELAKKYKIPMAEQERDLEEEAKYEKYYSLMEAAHDFFKQNMFENVGREALEYLGKRKLNPKLIHEYSLGYAPNSWDALYQHLLSLDYREEDIELLGLVKKTEKEHYYDVFRHRVIFPIYSSQGRIMAFGGRTLEQNKETPKYINSPDTPIFKKGKSLYGLERMQVIKKKDYAMIMEGYMDVLAVLSEGFDTAVAPLGTALTREQTALLKRYTNNVILSFDSDNAGQMAAERAIFLLKESGFHIRVLQLEGAKDPDEFLKKFGKEAFLQQVSLSLEAFDYLYQCYQKEYDLEDLMAKQSFVERFRGFFQSLPEALEQELYLKKFAELLGMDLSILRPIIYPKGWKKPSSYVSEDFDGEEGEIQREEDFSFPLLEKTSLQVLLLNLQTVKKQEEAKYYHFLEKMPFAFPLSQKILDLVREEIDKGQTRILDILTQRIKETEDYTEEEKQLVLELLVSCLEKEIFHEKKDMVCRAWLREMIKRNPLGKKELGERLKIKKLEHAMMKQKNIEDLLLKYEEYQMLRGNIGGLE